MPSRQDIKRLSRPTWDALETGLTLKPGGTVPAGVYDAIQLLDQIHGFQPGNLGFGKPVYISDTKNLRAQAEHSYHQPSASGEDSNPDVKSRYGVGTPKFEQYLAGESAYNDYYLEDKDTASYIKDPYRTAESIGHEMFHNVTGVLPNVEDGSVKNADPVLQTYRFMNQPTGYQDRELYWNPESDKGLFGGFEYRSVPFLESDYVNDIATKNHADLRQEIYDETISNVKGAPADWAHAYADYASKMLTSPEALAANQEYNLGKANSHKDYRWETDEILARGMGDLTRYWTDPDIGRPNEVNQDIYSPDFGKPIEDTHDYKNPYSLNDETYDAAEELMYQTSLGLKGEGLKGAPAGTDFSPGRSGLSKQSTTISNADNLDIRSDYRDLGWSEEKINEHLASTFGIPSPYFDEPVETGVSKDMTKVEAFSPKDEEGILGDLSARDLMSTMISLSPVGNVYTAMETAKGLAGEAEGNWLSDAIKEGYSNLNSWYGGIIGEPSGSGLFGESLDSGSYTDMGDYSYGTIDGIGVEDPY